MSGDAATPDGAARTVPRWRGLLTGRAGLRLALAWGWAEGTLFFLVPDLVLTLTAMFSFRQALRQTAAVLAGSLAAGAMMFTWARHDAPRAQAAVMAVPFVKPAMREKVRADFAAHGAWALVRGPLSGIPYKLYAVEAPAQVGLPAFLLASIPARLERLVSGLALFGAAGWLLRRKIAAHPRRTAALHAAYWAVVYGFYWTSP